MRILAITNMYPTERNPAEGTFVRQQVEGLREAGLSVEVLHIDRTAKGMGVYSTAGSDIVDAVKTVQPDVVHVMYGGILSEIATRRCNDAVVSLCGSDLFGEVSKSKVRIAAGWLGVQASLYAARRASAVVVKSEQMRSELAKHVRREKISVVPNGVDLEIFKPMSQAECREKLGWNSDIKHILFAGHPNNPIKRYSLAQAAMEKFSESGIRAELHEMRGVPHAQVPVWLNAADALLVTSVHEGSPNIVKEALACNLHVVSVDVGDVVERIGRIDGCQICQGDSLHLAEGLRNALAFRGEFYGRAAVESLSLDRISRRLIALYQDVIEQRTAMATA